MDIKEHGMLYKAEMVNAILREIDPKEQTRRPITFANSLTGGAVKRKEWHLLDWDNAEPWTVEIPVLLDGYSDYCAMRLPAWRVPFKGNLVTTVYPRIWPGHRIWVRETFIDLQKTPITGAGSEKYEGLKYWYRADNIGEMEVSGRWTPSLLMPRKASRIDLNVTGMRSQRIQEISEHDAKAEGATKAHLPDLGQTWATYKQGFEYLWDSINTERGFPWAGNHPVWIHDFKRVEVNR